MSKETIRVPDVGSSDPVDLIEISVKKGDVIAVEDTIVVLESEKASLEVPAPVGGKVLNVLVKTGDKVKEGDPLLEVEVSGESAGTAAAGQAEEKAADDEVAKPAPSPAAEKSADRVDDLPHDNESRQSTAAPAQGAVHSGARQQGRPSESVHAGPAVRKLARETGVDLAQVAASGPKDRVLKEDVHAYLKQRMEQPAGGSVAADLPEIDFSEFGPVEREQLGNLRKVAARNLHRAWITIPHVTQFDEADITELEAFRKNQNRRLEKEGVKLTMLAFLVKACAIALREFPHFNSSLEVGGEALIVKNYVHIGIAVDTPNGLVVPVLRDADQKGLKQIAREAGELAAKARDRKLTPGDMKGASFSISSLGGIGGTAFTPIVNWPEVAILGVSRSATKPVWDGQNFQPRLMLPLSLSYDHRVIDGAAAARFTSFLSELLGDMRQALL